MSTLQRRGSSFSRHDLERALDLTGVGIWAWDLATNRVSWTPTLERLFGFAPGTFDGTLQTYRSCLPPEDRDRLFQVIEDALARRESYFLAHRIIRRSDGAILHVECRGGVELDLQGRPVRMTGTVVDVTSHREAEARLRQSAELTALLDELASDYVYSVDLTSRALVPNTVAGSFKRITGYTAEEVEARGGWFQIIHPEDRAEIERFFAETFTGRPFVSEYRIVTATGEVRWLRDHVRPQVDEDGQVARIVGGVHDITERRRLEEHVRQAQKMEALARLAGGVAHDLNNLLTIIYSAVGLLKVQKAAAPDPEALEAITTSAHRAAELTRSLLALGRRQVGVLQTLSLNHLLLRARPLLVRSLQGGPRLVLAEGPAHCSVLVDPGQLHLVLLNLVLNAGAATGPDGVVQVEVGEVRFPPDTPGRPAELDPGDYGTLSIRDDGAGIPPEVLPRIFEPFFTTHEQGTGLGLSIAHGIVTQHRGALTVRSRVGEGSTFTVYLPRASGAPTRRPARTRPQFSGGGHEGILVVEDEAHLRALICRILRGLGYQVVEAASGEEALALDPGLVAGLALVLSDLRMPGTDGATVARTLGERHPHLAVLLMSGHAAGADALDEVTSGTWPFLTKPFTPQGLASKVREALDGARDKG